VNYFRFSNDYDFDIVTDPVFTPLNNDLLDYAAGWLMTLDVDVSNWTDCQVPLEGE
jgi:predicted nucleotidyltransferase component of viral defense system